MKYPVIVIPNSTKDFPFIITDPGADFFHDPILLTPRGENIRSTLFYSIDGVYKISSVHSSKKASWWNLLFHRNEPSFWNLKICFDRLGDFNISDLIDKLEKSIGGMPHDVWMQFHEKEVILHLLRGCKSFAEVITVGCLIGAWEADPENKAHLPELHDNSDEYDPETTSEYLYVMSEQYTGKLSRSSIQQIANDVQFYDYCCDNIESSIS